MELSKAMEIIEHKGLSLDVGVTKSQGFLGISKDLYSNDIVNLDIGTGITTAKEAYVGAHFKIKF